MPLKEILSTQSHAGDCGEAGLVAIRELATVGTPAPVGFEARFQAGRVHCQSDPVSVILLYGQFSPNDRLTKKPCPEGRPGIPLYRHGNGCGRGEAGSHPSCPDP